MSEKDDNIILISARFAEVPPIEQVRHGWDACQHEHVSLDDRLHLVSCRDCGEDRVDPFAVLLHMSRVWDRWHREAEELRKLRAEWTEHERQVWERRRDRHLQAHPDHDLKPGRQSWGPSWEGCRECRRIEQRYNSRWYPSSASGGAA